MVLAALLICVAVGKIGTELYRWNASAEERMELQRLGAALEEAGLAVIRTQVEATKRLAEIRQMDRGLRLFRGSISAQERRAVRGRMPDGLYDDYLYSLDSYNGSVAARNRRIEEWREAIARNQSEVDRYNSLADSIRSIATALGEPYFPIPTPAEVAVRNGFVPD